MTEKVRTRKPNTVWIGSRNYSERTPSVNKFGIDGYKENADGTLTIYYDVVIGLGGREYARRGELTIQTRKAKEGQA